MEDGGFAGAGGPNLRPRTTDRWPLRRRSAGWPDPRAVGSRGRARPGLQHGVPKDAPRGDRRLRPAVPGRRRRRRRLLAPAGRGGTGSASARAAVVWHPRRPSVRAYLRQQRGYGAAEALLERKWPEPLRGARACALDGPALRARPALGTGPPGRIYFGTWGSAALPGRCTVPGRPAVRRSARCPSGISRWLRSRRWRSPGCGGHRWRPSSRCRCRALIAWVVRRAGGARRAGFRSRAHRTPSQTLAMPALTTLLYLIQPLARLRGRMRTADVAACRRACADAPAPAIDPCLERDLARGRGSTRRDRAHRPRRGRSHLPRRVLGPLGPPSARWPAGRSTPANGGRGARRRAPTRAHPGHAARFTACDRDRGDARRGCAHGRALGGVAEHPRAGGGLARGGRPARMGVRHCDRLARARGGARQPRQTASAGSPVVAKRE